MRRRAAFLLGAIAAAPLAPLHPASAQGSPGSSLGASHLIVIVGAGGEPRYSEEFHAAALAILDAARGRFALAEANVVYLGENPSRAPGRISARSSRENVERALAATAARAGVGDELWVVLVGHGSGEGERSRFNLPGPDMTAADFRRALAPFGVRRVAFVNAASASGDFARVLAAPNRAVVTATKSALERNETLFARHFAAALAAPGADVDKDGRVTLLEAFTYTRREVAREYERDNRLLTEHAQLDDDGDGAASADPGPRARDGSLAAAIALTGGRASAAAVASASNPGVAPLLTQRSDLEARVAALRQRKATMEATAYERELERLLLTLARTSRAIRAAEGEAP